MRYLMISQTSAKLVIGLTDTDVGTPGDDDVSAGPVRFCEPSIQSGKNHLVCVSLCDGLGNDQAITQLPGHLTHAFIEFRLYGSSDLVRLMDLGRSLAS